MFQICFSFFKSLHLFQLAAELEGKAAALRKEALQHLTIALAGSGTRELFTLLVTFFCKGTDVDPFSFIDVVPIIKRPLDLTDTESESEEGDKDAASTSTGPGRAPTAPAEPSPSTSAPSVKKPIKIRQKATYQDKCADVQEAIGFLPENPGSLPGSLPCTAWARTIMVLPSTPAHTQNAVTLLILGTSQGVGVTSTEFT